MERGPPKKNEKNFPGQSLCGNARRPKHNPLLTALFTGNSRYREYGKLILLNTEF